MGGASQDPVGPESFGGVLREKGLFGVFGLENGGDGRMPYRTQLKGKRKGSAQKGFCKNLFH